MLHSGPGLGGGAPTASSTPAPGLSVDAIEAGVS